MSRLGSFWWVFLMYLIGGGMVAVGMNSFGGFLLKLGFGDLFSVVLSFIL